MRGGERIMKKILEFLDNQGVVAAITGIFVVIGAVVPNLTRLSSPRKEEDELPLLSQHPFFTRSESIKHHIDMTFSMDNKGKELIFKEILINQITIYQHYLKSFCETVDSGEIKDSNELYESFLKMIDEMTYKHYNYFKTSPSYTLDEIEVFKKVMKKYVIWNTSNVDLLQRNVVMVCNSSYCRDINTQVAVIMDLFGGILVNSLSDAVSSLETINGDLKGCVYKGVSF